MVPLLTAASVLLNAATLIEERGHAKGVNKDEHGCLCIYDAIESTHSTPNARNRAIEALRNRLNNMPDGKWTISGWNDLPETTPKKVVDFLREVAKEVKHDE